MKIVPAILSRPPIVLFCITSTVETRCTIVELHFCLRSLRYLSLTVILEFVSIKCYLQIFEKKQKKVYMLHVKTHDKDHVRCRYCVGVGWGGYCRVTKKKTTNIWVELRVVWASANVNGVAANVGFSFLIKVSFVGLFVFVNMMVYCSVNPPTAFLFCKNTLSVLQNKICKCWRKLNGKLMYVINWICLLYVWNYSKKRLKKNYSAWIFMNYRKSTNV